MNEWRRVANAVIARRVELGMTTQQQLVEATGLTRRVLSDIEHGRRDNYDASTLARLERALRWVPGSVTAILDGGEPTPMPDDRASFYIEGPSDEVALIATVAAAGLPRSELERVTAYIEQRRADFNRELLREVQRLIDAERSSGDETDPLPPAAPSDDVPRPRREDQAGEHPDGGIPYTHLAN